MKNKIFMYLFFFALLFVIFQYMNQKAIFESQNSDIQSLSEKLTKAEDSIITLNSRVADLNYFALQGNENAMDYLDKFGYDALEVENFVRDAIYDQNLIKGGNPLVPLEGMNGAMLVNKVKFLNHKWLMADFTDGKYWGEMLLSFGFNEENELEFNTLGSVLYPNI